MKKQEIIEKERAYICESIDDIVNIININRCNISKHLTSSLEVSYDEFGCFIMIHEYQSEQRKKLIELGYDYFETERHTTICKLYLKLNNDIEVNQ